MPALYLIDGSALVYRSHFAFNRTPLTSAVGQPTGATYGVALFLHSLDNNGAAGAHPGGCPPWLTRAEAIFHDPIFGKPRLEAQPS